MAYRTVRERRADLVLWHRSLTLAIAILLLLITALLAWSALRGDRAAGAAAAVTGVIAVTVAVAAFMARPDRLEWWIDAVPLEAALLLTPVRVPVHWLWSRRPGGSR